MEFWSIIDASFTPEEIGELCRLWKLLADANGVASS